MTDPTPPRSQQDDQSLGELFATVSQDLSQLVHKEIELAKIELSVEAKKAATGGALFGAAGVLGLLSLPMLLIAAAFGLVAAGLDPAVAFLVIAGALLIIAAVLVLVGKRTAAKVGPPERTIRTTKETAAFLKGLRHGDAQSPST